MGIPKHFGSSVIQRTIQLLDEFEPKVASTEAKEFGGPLTTTFLLGLAMPLLVIPMERYLRARADRPQHEAAISDKLKQRMEVELVKPFEKTAFYVGNSWVEARHGLPFVHPLGWTENFHETLFNGAGSVLARQSPAKELITFLRHALAHGAIAYLDKDGRGTTGNTAEQIAFISAVLGKKNNVIEYAVVAVNEKDFSAFLRKWADWLLKLGADEGIALEKQLT